jgi:hypothetical protein
MSVSVTTCDKSIRKWWRKFLAVKNFRHASRVPKKIASVSHHSHCFPFRNNTTAAAWQSSKTKSTGHSRVPPPYHNEGNINYMRFYHKLAQKVTLQGRSMWLALRAETHTDLKWSTDVRTLSNSNVIYSIHLGSPMYLILSKLDTAHKPKHYLKSTGISSSYLRLVRMNSSP